MKDIVIIGAGGFGREVHWLIEEINSQSPTWNFLGYVDEGLDVGTQVGKSEVIGDLTWLKNQSLNVVCAIGDPLTKRNVLSKIEESTNQYPTLIHPDVRYSDQVTIGEGCIICSGSILTVDIKIGKHVIINLDSTVGHDATIGNYSTILPSVNVSGNVIINECVSVGTGAKIIQQLSIGKNTIIGAGAIVTKDIPENVVAVGMPAKVIKERV